MCGRGQWDGRVSGVSVGEGCQKSRRPPDKVARFVQRSVVKNQTVETFNTRLYTTVINPNTQVNEK